MITSLRYAVAFLTRLPGGLHPAGQEQISRSVVFFPVVGILVGGLAAASFQLGEWAFTPAIAAVVCLCVTAGVTGGLHEDGLADSMDALGGGWDREQRMEIFKDSRHGTFGVLSLVLVSLLKFAALADLVRLGSWPIAGVIVAMHVVGRSAAVVAMGVLPSARPTGLGASYGTTLPLSSMAVATLVGSGALIIGFGTAAPATLVAVGGASLAVCVWAMKKIGGATGDILGAVEQACEVAVLLSAVAFL